MRLSSVLIAMALLNHGSAAAQDAALPVTTLGDNNVVRLPPRSTSSDQKVVVSLANLPADLRSTKPTLVDRNMTSGGTTVVFRSEAAEQVQAEATVVWLIPMSVSNLPENDSQGRLVQVTIGTHSYARPYTLTNRLPAATTWSISTPAVPWIVTWDGEEAPLTIAVTTQDQPLAELTIVQSTLRDASNLMQLGPERFTIDEKNRTIPAQTTRAVPILLTSKGLAPHGKFTGTLTFAVGGSNVTQAAAVTLNASSFSMRLIGAGVIFLGLVMSSVVLNRLKPLVARVQALRPVLRTRKTVDELRTKIASAVRITQVSLDRTARRLRALDELISTSALDEAGLLPSRSATLLSENVDATAKLQERLTDVGGQLRAIAAVVSNGIEPAGSDWLTLEQHRSAIEAVLGRLDQLGASATSAETAGTAAAAEDAGYRPRPESDVMLGGVLGRDPVNLEQATYFIDHAGEMAFAIWAVVSLITGCAILIVPNAGFGSPLDLIYCFLWGIGLPTAGATLQTLTPSGVATGIGVALPKSRN